MKEERTGSPGVVSDAWEGLNTPLRRVLGPRTAPRFEHLGLNTIQDLLYHIPFRLAYRGQLMPLAQALPGADVTVIGRVLSSTLRPMNARRGFLLTLTITDGTQDLDLTFFAKSQRPLSYHQSRLHNGALALFSGTVSLYRSTLQLTHPDYELIDEEHGVDVEAISRPIPIYHASAKLPSWKIAQTINTLLETLPEEYFTDPLPQAYREEHQLPSLHSAITALHTPESEEQWNAALHRMKHQEAFILQTSLAQSAHTVQEMHTLAYPVKEHGILASLDHALPYTLTPSQQRVGEEISEDLSHTYPMQRLLQGDVGSGKTLVALRAMLQIVDHGGQAALLAPTEVLAFQHYETLRTLTAHIAQAGNGFTPPHIELLTSSLNAAQRRQTLAHIASGQADIIIGTHALLSPEVSIPFLGLAVIDEQHRFGVEQRAGLGEAIHTLAMTATPIPRTIAMSVFGDLNISSLTELPAGRQPVTTTLVPENNPTWMNRVWERAREEINAGGRVYIVVPRIDSTHTETPQAEEHLFTQETPPLTSLEELYGRLQAEPHLAGIPIGIMHGRLCTEEKTTAMHNFTTGTTPILLATTVIEVGVDVKEATMMIIMNAERYGLAQLHQLRGRIGRGNKPGLCLAVTTAQEGTPAMERLHAFASTTDGFILSEQDLHLRNEGDVLGSTQSGKKSSLTFLSVTTDEKIITQARQAARKLITTDPHLAHHPELNAAITHLNPHNQEFMERA